MSVFFCYFRNFVFVLVMDISGSIEFYKIVFEFLLKLTAMKIFAQLLIENNFADLINNMMNVLNLYLSKIKLVYHYIDRLNLNVLFFLILKRF
jgi:hypothetical protein